MSITYSGMNCKHWINPLRLVIEKHSIAVHCSIWRHHDNIWRTPGAERGGSTGFQRWKLYFMDKLGIMNKYFTEHLIKHNFFYIVQLIFLQRIPLLCRNAVFVHWRLRTCLRNRSFAKAYIQQIVISFST